MSGNYGIKKANGMGSVYRLQGNRRKPWVACVTISLRHSNDAGYKQKHWVLRNTGDGGIFTLEL